MLNVFNNNLKEDNNNIDKNLGTAKKHPICQNIKADFIKKFNLKEILVFSNK